MKLKPRLLHNPVVRAIGRRCGYRANKAVPIDDIVSDVLTMTGFGPDEIREFGVDFATDGEDPAEVGLKKIRRKIHFAFRNQRDKAKGQAATSYCKVPLTVLVAPGKWALTDFGGQR